MNSSTPIHKKNMNNIDLPWKLIIHILIILITSFQAIYSVVNITTYIRAQDRQLFNLFINTNDKTQFDFTKKIYLFTVDQIRNQINSSIQNYYDLQNNLVEAVIFDKNKSNNVTMEVNYMDNTVLNNPYLASQLMTDHIIKREKQYTLNNKTLGPFDYPNSDVKNFLNDILNFKVNYEFRTYVPYFYYNNYYCFSWHVNQCFNFEQRGHFENKLHIYRSTCDNVYGTQSFFHNFTNHLILIHIILLVLATISLIQTLKYIYKIARLYGKIKEDYKNKNLQSKYYISGSKDSDYYNPLLDKDYCEKVDEIEDKDKKIKNSLTYKEDKKLFNYWYIVCLIGNVIQIFSAIMCLIDPDIVLTSTECLVGFGCSFAYINILRYFEFNDNFSIIGKSIRKGLPTMLRYLFGVLPVLLGFAILGMSLFWRSERFVNLSTAIFTLFAFLNGDSVFSICMDLRGASYFLGQLYCYMFGMIFTIIVVNVFVAITEEAYMTVRMKSPYYWIYAFLKIDDKFIELRENEDEVKVLPEHMKKSNFSRPERYDKNLNKDQKIKMNEVNKKISNFDERAFSLKMITMRPPNSQSNELINQMHSLDQSCYKSKFAKKNYKEKNEFTLSLKNLLSKNHKYIEDLLKQCEKLSKVSSSELKNQLINKIKLHFCKLQQKMDIIKRKLSNK